MSVTRRQLLKSGLAGVAAWSAGCRDPQQGPVAQEVAPAAAPTATAAGGNMKTVQVRCKGTFAFLHLNGDGRAVAVAKPTPASEQPPHAVFFLVQKEYVDGYVASEWTEVTKGKVVYLGRNKPVVSFDWEAMESASMSAQPTEHVTSAALADEWCPTGDVNDDSRWFTQESIIRLDRLYKNKPRVIPGWQDKAEFAIGLPKGTQFNGCAPWQTDVRNNKMEFRDKYGKGSTKGARQAVTDVVRFHVKLQKNVTITFLDAVPGNSTTTPKQDGGPITLKLDAVKDTDVLITLVAAYSPHYGWDPYLHFAMIYNFFEKPETLDVLPFFAAVDCKENPQDGKKLAQASRVNPKGAANDYHPYGGEDIFCPGGEGGGG